MIITNGFSTNMLTYDSMLLRFERISLDTVVSLITTRLFFNTKIINAIANSEIDTIVRKILALKGVEISEGQKIPVNIDYNSETSNKIIIAQYRGPKLHEGAISLPKGSVIEWFLVTTM